MTKPTKRKGLGEFPYEGYKDGIRVA